MISRRHSHRSGVPDGRLGKGGGCSRLPPPPPIRGAEEGTPLAEGTGAAGDTSDPVRRGIGPGHVMSPRWWWVTSGCWGRVKGVGPGAG